MKNIISYKMHRKIKEELSMKLKLMKGLRAFHGLTYVEITLKQISLAKQLFILNIEQGEEAFIPALLSQKKLALSYRFYDPILKIIQDECSDAKRDFFSLKNKLCLGRVQDDDIVRKMLLSIGIDEELNSDTKQVFKHSVINTKENNEINHLASEHP